MRVVVTGAAGFIGSHLCEALVGAGHDVVGIDCFTDYYAREAKEANLQTSLTLEGFTLVEADLRSASLEPLLEGADAVINEAATPGLVLSWDDFERYQSTNLSAVKRLVDACIAVGVGHLVQASTSSVYGAQATGDEDSTCLPVSPYGVTKLAAEHLLRAHSETFGLPLTILRYFSIYGPRQRPDMAYRIFCEKLLKDEPITIYGDGRQSRSNTYVTDCVAATIAALDGPADGSVFNIGGGQEIELLEAVEVISQNLGVEPVIDFKDARRGDQRRTAADITRAQTVLGWNPVVEPKDGLANQVAWVRGLGDAS
ncbi:MAG: NAD-dependent epimerase/dehydratase family protein [Acidimicrobiales bacterium]|nr:NAD-dependent epimerase/dehydratase family protein [Acidimicrobiales bacterium]